jgi:hypothetical protein
MFGLFRCALGRKDLTRSPTHTLLSVSQDVDYAWLQTQDNFNSLLKDLNEACGTADGSIPDGPPPDSVLKDSFKNRERGARLAMFEKRFRKGKDLSLMSPSDLECILGASSKRPDRLKSASDKAATAAAAAATDHEAVEVTGIKTIVHSESVADYFAAKMAARKLRAAQQPPAPAAPTDDGAFALPHVTINTILHALLGIFDMSACPLVRFLHGSQLKGRR